MNQLLFDRETGALGSKAFARFQANTALNSLWLSDTRFDGGEVSKSDNIDEGSDTPFEEKTDDESTWASRAGVNALAIDKFEGRLYVTLLQCCLHAN